MTPTLRKAHRYIWYTLAGALPLGWAAAIWVMPDTVWQQPVRPGQPDALPTLVLSKQSGDFVVNLRQKRTGTRQQVEFLVTKPLTQANTSVILEGQPEVLLGALGPRGTWRFDLDSLAAARRPFRLRLEDRIAHKVLRTIPLQE